MLIEKNLNGSFVLSEILKGYLFKRIYYFYSKKDAIKMFNIEKRVYLKNLKYSYFKIFFKKLIN